MKKRWLLWGLPILAVVSIAVTLKFVVQEGLEIWGLAQIQQAVSEHSPVEMASGGLDISWIPLKASLKNVRLRAKTPDELGFNMARVNLLEARVDALQLLTGRLALSVLLLEDVAAEVNLDPHLKGSGPTPEIPWDQIFKITEQIPVRSLAVRNVNLSLHSKKTDFEIGIKDLAARLTLRSNRINLELQSAESSARFRDLSSPWQLGAQALITPTEIEITQFRLTAGRQGLDASGMLTDTRELLRAPRGQMQIDTKLSLPEIRAALPPAWGVPDLLGEVDLGASLELRGKKLPIGNFKLATRGVFIHESEVGNVEAQGKFDGRSLDLPTLSITQTAGRADLTGGRAEFSEPNPFDNVVVKGKVSTKNLSLHALLKGIGVGDLPLEVLISGEVDCGGPALPKPLVVCVGQASGRDLRVDIEEKGKLQPLVALKEFSADGGVQITHESVTYQAKAKVGQDTGTSSGLISYEKGFVIQYDTAAVRLDHVGSIAGLKVEGLAAISGSTRGDSDAATFEMKTKGRDIYFEDFFLGDAETQIKYAKGKLSFLDLTGRIIESPYRADVEADLMKSRIKVTGNSPQLRIEDLFAVFPRIFTVPVALTGHASAQVELEGPFQLGKLSYHLQAKVPHFTAAGEIFKDGDIEIRSIDGEVKSERASFRKGSQSITARGEGHPNGQIDISLVGNQLLMEESELITALGANISGFMDLGVQITGFILDPEVNIQAQLGQMIIEDQEFPPSAASLLLNRRKLEGSVRLFAGRLYGDLVVPLADNQPFRVKLQASDWNFATLATLIGGGSLLSEYESSLSGDLSLASDRGGLFTATGQGTIQSFSLRRGSQTLANRLPMRLNMQNGVANFENFRVEGGREFIAVQGTGISRDNLRMKIDGDLSLRILQIFVPFLEELGGNGRINASVSGSLFKPEILGSAFLTDGFARIRGFPHALERASADVQFSASRISINDIKASMAGGTVRGEGSVSLLGPRNIPVNIQARAEGMTLNVPDKIQTTGDAELTFAGNWFPYTLAGTYRVYGGLFAKELDDSGTSTSVQQSFYLPKLIRQNAFEPVQFDLQVDLIRPLQLKNTLIEGQATGNLQIRGTPRVPLIQGVVNVPSGAKVTFRDKIFDLNSATLKFTDPKEINPELFVSARARVNEFDISLLVQGTAKAPLVRMSSTPPLPESDIITLLALGVTSQKLEKQIQSREQESSTQNELIGILSQALPPAKTLQKQLGVSLQVSSQYDDTKNIAVQKITLSRQINERVNAAVSQSRGEANSTEAKVQYYFNPNLSAVGTWEGRERYEGTSINAQESRSESIFGIDLEFKKEFK